MARFNAKPRVHNCDMNIVLGENQPKVFCLSKWVPLWSAIGLEMRGRGKKLALELTLKPSVLRVWCFSTKTLGVTNEIKLMLMTRSKACIQSWLDHRCIHSHPHWVSAGRVCLGQALGSVKSVKSKHSEDCRSSTPRCHFRAESTRACNYSCTTTSNDVMSLLGIIESEWLADTWGQRLLS